MDFYNLLEEDQEIFDRCSLRYKLVWSDVEIIKYYQWYTGIWKQFDNTNVNGIIYGGNLISPMRRSFLSNFNDNDWTLMDASCGGHAGIVRLLIDIGANFDVENGTGRTPLNFALMYNHEEVARLLVRAGAYIDDDDYPKLKKMFRSCQEQEERREKIMRLMGEE